MTLPVLPFVRGRLDGLFGAGTRRGGRVLGTLCLIAGASVLAHVVSVAISQQLHLSQLEAQAREAAVRSRPTPGQQGVAVPAIPAAERARINLIVRRLNLPWADIFNAFENAAMPEVFVLAIEPDAERGVVRVQTQGDRLDDLFEHAHRMQRDPRSLHVNLQRVDADESAPARPPRLHFELELSR